MQGSESSRLKAGLRAEREQMGKNGEYLGRAERQGQGAKGQAGEEAAKIGERKGQSRNGWVARE